MIKVNIKLNGDKDFLDEATIKNIKSEFSLAAMGCQIFWKYE